MFDSYLYLKVRVAVLSYIKEMISEIPHGNIVRALCRSCRRTVSLKVLTAVSKLRSSLV
jgi:hypothetical protein